MEESQSLVKSRRQVPVRKIIFSLVENYLNGHQKTEESASFLFLNYLTSYIGQQPTLTPPFLKLQFTNDSLEYLT